MMLVYKAMSPNTKDCSELLGWLVGWLVGWCLTALAAQTGYIVP